MPAFLTQQHVKNDINIKLVTSQTQLVAKQYNNLTAHSAYPDDVSYE